MWLLGMDRKRNPQFVEPVSLAMQFEANASKFFAVFNCLIVLTDCSDAEMSRSSDFVPTDRQRQTMIDKTDCFAPCKCVLRVIEYYNFWLCNCTLLAPVVALGTIYSYSVVMDGHGFSKFICHVFCGSEILYVCREKQKATNVIDLVLQRTLVLNMEAKSNWLHAL